MTTRDLTIDDLHSLLVVGEVDEFDLDMIQAALNFRREQIGLAKIPVRQESTVTSEFKIGDTVVFNASASPKYLGRNKVTGIVRKVNAKSVSIDVETDASRARRYSGAKKVRCPKTIVDKV